MSIPFTQFLRPDGRRIPVEIDRPPEIEKMAAEIIKAGLVFECEVLTTGMISLTVADKRLEEDLFIQLCPNGTEVPTHVDALVKEAYEYVK